jgi:hypothetical protein
MGLKSQLNPNIVYVKILKISNFTNSPVQLASPPLKNRPLRITSSEPAVEEGVVGKET